MLRTLHVRALLVLTLLAATASAQPGTPDPTFGTDGVAFLPLGAGSAVSPALYPDGRIAVLTSAGVARLLPSGTPDPSFGTGGAARIDLSPLDLPRPTLFLNSLLPLADGSVLVVAQISLAADFPANRGALLKLTPTGELDAGFGTGGVAFVDPTRYGGGLVKAVLLPGGDVLAMSTGQDAETEAIGVLTARFRPDGTLNASYGVDGIAFAPSRLLVTDFALAADGAPVFVGRAIRTFPLPLRFLAVVGRLDASGQLDPSFGSGGLTLLDPGATGSEADAVALDGSGRAYVSGSAFGTSSDPNLNRVFAARLDAASGTLDAAFGTDGLTLAAPPGGTARASEQSIALTGDRVTVGAPVALAGGGSGGAAFGFALDGALDGGFGDGGIALLPVEGAIGGGLVGSPGGRVLLTGGGVDGQGRSRGVVARLLGGDVGGSTEIQIVHDAAALAGDGPLSSYGPIEFYVDGASAPAATLEYGQASPYVPAPTDRAFEIRARPVAQPPAPLSRKLSFPVRALPPGRYVISLMGIPEEILSLYPRRYFSVRIVTVINGVSFPRHADRVAGADVPVTVFHAVPDAGPLDLRVRETGALLATALDAGSGATTALAPGTYTVDATLAGQADVLLSQAVTVDPGDVSLALSVRGFLDPAANLNGPPLRIGAVDGEGDAGQPTAGQGRPSGDLSLALAPNPARGDVRLTVSLGTASPARATVHDVLGREVAVVWDGPLAAGAHALPLSTRGLAPGVYLVRLASGGRTAARQLTVVR